MQAQLYEYELNISEEAIRVIGFQEIINCTSALDKKQADKIKLKLYPIQSQSSFNNQLNLKLSLLNLNQSFNKQPKTRWVVICGEQIVQIKKMNQYKAMFVILKYSEDNDHPDLRKVLSCVSIQVFTIREIEQVMSIMLMNERQYKARCKMENILRVTNNKCADMDLKHQFKQIANSLATAYFRKSIKDLINYMIFYGKNRKNLLKKYMNQWLISHFLKQIQKTQQQLVTAFDTTKSNRKLLTRCFYGWKKIVLSNQN